MITRLVLAAVLVPFLAPTPAPTGSAAPADAPAAAGSDARWSVQPSTADGPDGRDYVIRRAAPGERVTDFVAITNLSTGPQSFTVYGTDAYTTDDGSFALLPAAQQAVDIGSWISLGATSYTVPANTRLDVPFTLTVPRTATPGDHAGGIIASLTEEQTDAAGQKVLVDRRVAARVYVTVSGDVTPGLTIDTVRLRYTPSTNPATGGDMLVTYRVRNSGNLRLSGAGTVRVTGPFGWELAGTAALPIPELLPGAALTVTERITGVQPTVRLAAQVTVTPAGLSPTERTTSVWAWPWLLVGLAGLAVLVLAYRMIRRRRQERAGSPSTH
ncbi:WxL protein peptidoglycan domain-containing protein [Actinoplanes sp. NPDC051494]|uniref:WxL protein peptidoglycan domain-containing protein n=1 Tax=Actinoplanes sp. NPDC051494 TaxID=3363907 RepID=UPI0037A23606